MKVRAIILLFIFSMLQACASSTASRTAASSVDDAYLGATKPSEFDLADSYQNASQTTKGVLIGGVTGGVIGGFTNGIGVIPGSLTGAILGGALGAYIDAHTTLVDKLENRGVKIFVLGDQVLIVLPSNRIFDDTTSNINYSAYTTLDLVAQLIGNYTNMSVKVAAYTNDSGTPQIDRVLSRQQADNVAKALWKRGVNTRLLYAEGYGGTHLVTRNSLDWKCSENYRIEITFEKLPT